MAVNCAAGHYWKAITPTPKVFYEIPVPCNEEQNNFAEPNDSNIEKKRRSSNVENMDVNSFSSPSTSGTFPQKEPLFKKNQSRVSHVNGGEPYSQAGFEIVLHSTPILPHTASLSPKKRKHVRTFQPKKTTQSKKKFIKLQDKVKQNRKNISNAEKQRAHMNSVKNTQSPHLASTKYDLKQSNFLNGIYKTQECEVPKAREKRRSEKEQELTAKESKKVQQLTAKESKKVPQLTAKESKVQQLTKKESKKVQQLTGKDLSEKIEQLTEINYESRKRKPKTVSNAISVKGQQRSTENSKKEKIKSIPPSSMRTDSYTTKVQPINNSSKKEISSRKKPKKVPNHNSPRKKNEVCEQKKRTPKKYKRISPIESSDDESHVELNIKKKLKPIDSETESDEINTQICLKENNPIFHEVEAVLPEVITLSVQDITNFCSTLNELERSKPISSNEIDSEENLRQAVSSEIDSVLIVNEVPCKEHTLKELEHSKPISSNEIDSEENGRQPVSSEIDSVLIVNEVPCKENKSTSCNPVKKQTSSNPYRNLDVPFQDNYHQPAFFTGIIHVKESVASIINVSMPSTSRIESNEIVELDAPPTDVEIIDVISSDEHEEEEDDDVVYLGINKAKG